MSRPTSPAESYAFVSRNGDAPGSHRSNSLSPPSTLSEFRENPPIVPTDTEQEAEEPVSDDQPHRGGDTDDESAEEDATHISISTRPIISDGAVEELTRQFGQAHMERGLALARAGHRGRSRSRRTSPAGIAPVEGEPAEDAEQPEKQDGMSEMPPSARVYTPRAFVAPRSFRPETPPPSAGKPPRILKSQPVSAPKVTVNTRVASSPVRPATSAKISRTVRTTIKPVHSHGSRSRSSSSSLSPRRSKTPIKRGVYEMPPLGTRHAPKKFTGKAEDVADFISHYERLLRQYQVTNGRDRCRSILQYCSTQVKQYIKGLREFADFDWRALKKNLLFFYDAEKGEHTYNACDMVDFAQRS
ncbi:hypothetical protein EV121DRAFT_274928, partial [Schizophyllum commune]